MKTIELFPAAEFICEECGRNSYVSLINAESNLPPEELKEFYRKAHGTAAPEDVEGMWLMTPPKVKCVHCNAEFLTFEGEMGEE